MTRSSMTGMAFMAKCILIVDDNAIIRRSLRRILESVEDWQVCGEAVDGFDGIEKAKELHPDLIILDLSMPRLNGLETARVLSKTMPDVPLLMYSVHMDGIVEKEAVAAGVRAVLSKASDVGALIDRAHALLNGGPTESTPNQGT
jgi:DNA-binding NarL/FixJ family response regulator